MKEEHRQWVKSQTKENMESRFALLLSSLHNRRRADRRFLSDLFSGLPQRRLFFQGTQTFSALKARGKEEEKANIVTWTSSMYSSNHKATRSTCKNCHIHTYTMKPYTYFKKNPITRTQCMFLQTRGKKTLCKSYQGSPSCVHQNSLTWLIFLWSQLCETPILKKLGQ